MSVSVIAWIITCRLIHTKRKILICTYIFLHLDEYLYHSEQAGPVTTFKHCSCPFGGEPMKGLTNLWLLWRIKFCGNSLGWASYKLSFNTVLGSLLKRCTLLPLHSRSPSCKEPPCMRETPRQDATSAMKRENASNGDMFLQCWREMSWQVI